MIKWFIFITILSTHQGRLSTELVETTSETECHSLGKQLSEGMTEIANADNYWTRYTVIKANYRCIAVAGEE